MRRTSELKSLLAAACLVLAGWISAASGGELSKLPVNKWVKLYEGVDACPPVHARFTWLPGSGKGLLFTKAGRKAPVKLSLFSPESGSWSSGKLGFPEKKGARLDAIANSCVLLPGARRLLLLTPPAGRSQAKTHTWLADAESGKVELLDGQPNMSDKSADFNPAGRRPGGVACPRWGILVYDAHNEEVVSVCGGQTWGRVGKEKEKVEVGDWIYDENAKPKRIRRLVEADRGKLTEARKYYPANCGTWIFPEASRKWKPIAQPIGKQPSGRLLPGAAYDAAEKKIVLFGGDDYSFCLRDTWVYDCQTRKWSEAKPKVAPPARAAHAMVYVPDQKIVLLAGGYGPGWKARKDVWVYRTAENQWTKLALGLPAAGLYCSSDYVPEKKAALLSTSAGKGTGILMGLRLDLRSAPKAAAPAKADPKADFHRAWGARLPEEWDSPKNKGTDPEARRKELAKLPVNTWVLQKPPMKVIARVWGKYIYDPRTKKAFAWGGGHYGYIGADVSEYDLLRNRWRGMNDPVSFKRKWEHPSAGGGGLNFRGWRLMGGHARKSYAVDPVSNTVVNFKGDVYSISERRYVTNIGGRPYKGLSHQPLFVTASHGLYSYSDRWGVYRADISAGKWLPVAEKGGPPHSEYNSGCHDTKRDRLLYVTTKGAVWSFDFKTKKWSQERPTGRSPKSVAGDPAYVLKMDAIMMLCRPRGAKEPRQYFYRLEEKKWYTAPHRGDKLGKGYGSLQNSLAYDPELKLAVHMTDVSRVKHVEILLMRLDPEGLKLTPCD